MIRFAQRAAGENPPSENYFHADLLGFLRARSGALRFCHHKSAARPER
jgi:hypothetical protein